MKKIKNFAIGLTLLSIPVMPVNAAEITGINASADDVRIYELDMNDQTPLETLKRQVIQDRSDYDAAVNLTTIDMDASTIYTNTFDRTQSGIQKVTIYISLARENADSIGYDFIQNAAVKMVKPNGPQVILKSPSITIDLNSTFSYADNIGYVSNNGISKLPVIKESDNVDTSTEGTYTCWMEFYDESGQKSEISYDVVVQKPVEVVRAEEEAAEAQRQAEEAARRAEEAAAAQAAQAASYFSSNIDISAFTATGNSIVDYATQFIGCSYVWGGSTPAGFDCSGFTQYVYGAFGYSMAHSSYAQETYGTIISPSDAQPGDLVTYTGHAAIYIGNGMIVHAMDPSHGVTISSMYGVSNGNMMVHRLN